MTDIGNQHQIRTLSLWLFKFFVLDVAGAPTRRAGRFGLGKIRVSRTEFAAAGNGNGVVMTGAMEVSSRKERFR